MPEDETCKISESDVRSWLYDARIPFYMFDTPGVYIHRVKKISYYVSFCVNFSVKTGKLLVYVANKRSPKKEMLLVTSNKNKMLKTDLYGLYTDIFVRTKGGQ